MPRSRSTEKSEQICRARGSRQKGVSLLCSLLSLRAGPEYGRLSVRGSVSGRVSCCDGAHDAGLSIGFASHRRSPENKWGGFVGRPWTILGMGNVFGGRHAVLGVNKCERR